MQNAIDNDKTKDGDTTPADVPTTHPGVTIDLSRKNIRKLPDEVVDILQYRAER